MREDRESLLRNLAFQRESGQHLWRLAEVASNDPLESSQRLQLRGNVNKWETTVYDLLKERRPTQAAYFMDNVGFSPELRPETGTDFLVKIEETRKLIQRRIARLDEIITKVESE